MDMRHRVDHVDRRIDEEERNNEVIARRVMIREIQGEGIMFEEIALLEVESIAQPRKLIRKADCTKVVGVAALMGKPGCVGVYAVLLGGRGSGRFEQEP